VGSASVVSVDSGPASTEFGDDGGVDHFLPVDAFDGTWPLRGATLRGHEPMTDATAPERRDDSGDGDAEPGLVRGGDATQRLTLAVEHVSLPVGVRVGQVRLSATGSAVRWALLALAVATTLASLAWLARAT
jgi:hypothetical protein